MYESITKNPRGIKMIRLDWDNITLIEAKRRIELIKQYSLVQEIELRLSATKGFHVYIISYAILSAGHILRLRRMWLDDGNRLVKDVMNIDASYRDVMFRFKEINGVRWYEHPLIKYIRYDEDSDIWIEKNPNQKKVVLQISQAKSSLIARQLPGRKNG